MKNIKAKLIVICILALLITSFSTSDARHNQMYNQLLHDSKVVYIFNGSLLSNNVEQRNGILTKVDEIYTSNKNIHKFFYPSGPVVSYGINFEGYIEVVVCKEVSNEDLVIMYDAILLNKSLLVPVVFKSGNPPQLLEDYYNFGIYRPLIGGVKISRSDNWGTLGFAARDLVGRTGFVTNSHVVKYIVGEPMYQPRADSSNYIGASSIVSHGPNAYTARSDSAFVPLAHGLSIKARVRRPSGNELRITSYREPKLFDKVGKVGARTGESYGTINGKLDVTNSRTGTILTDQWRILLDDEYGALGGDSGSPVFINNWNGTVTLVGVLWASDLYRYAYFSGINSIRSDLGITPITE